jgi:uncharacterized protein YgbK (DUF1537 family)
MPRVLVIADDLTGALDAAAQFANSGVASCVLTAPESSLEEWFGRFEAVSINAETRHLDAARAAETVRQLVGAGTAAGVEFFHKKTDSTLRGNLGAELDALRLSAGTGRLAFVPASPQLGRTTVDGFQFVSGQPLHESAYARDPRNPVRDSFIPNLLAAQASARTVVVTQAALRDVGEAFFTREGIYIFDAATDAGVDEVAAVLKRHKLLGVTAGPARLMRSLPSLLDFQRASPPLRARPGPMLAVIGSVNEVSRRQADHAEAHGFASFLVPGEMLLQGDAVHGSELAHLRQAIAAALRSGRSVLLRSSETAADVDAVLAAGERLGFRGNMLFERVTSGLAAVVRRVLNETHPPVLAVFGGDTLAAISHALGWRGFAPRGEWLPGVVGADLETGLHLISKPGGFGPDEVLPRIGEALRTRK